MNLIHIPYIRRKASWLSNRLEPTNDSSYLNKKTGNIRYGKYKYSWSSDTFSVKIQGLNCVNLLGGECPEYGAWKHLGRLSFSEIPEEIQEVFVEIKY